MAEFGQYALCFAWLCTVFGMLAGIYAGARESAAWSERSRRMMLVSTITVFLSIFALGWLFTHDDYTNQYVWQHSNRDMSPIYKISAIWGGMDGSMLLWAFFLSLYTGSVAVGAKHYSRRLVPWLMAALHSTLFFFLTVITFFTNPFRFVKADFIPPDGNGLNPLLQNPYMAVHPPTLYLGFTGLSIPFCFCMAALLSGDLSNEWIRLTRRWTLLAWGFLTTGIVLGGHWAYLELGWGGFWAWDPVENASFLPWLTGTAFLHSVMVQERKNMLRFWNIWLVVLTYALTVFGTFLTRSGVVQSVHAFASTDIGWVFLLYLGLIFVVAAVLSIFRRTELRSERMIESFVSREAAFLMNNLVFLSICFSVLWGVMFPVLSEAVTGVKQAVGIPFFNTLTVPMFLLLILLMGLGPMIAWRRASLKGLIKTFLMPFIAGMCAGILLVWAGIVEFYPVLSYALCVFVLFTIMGELHRGYRAQRSIAPGGDKLAPQAARLLRRHRVRFGGYLVHIGVLIVTVAITASMAHKYEHEFTLSTGETFEFGRFKVTLDKVYDGVTPNYSALYAEMRLQSRKSGEVLTVLRPELRRYIRNQESTTEVALRMGPREDVYLVLAGLDETGKQAAFKVFVNPLQIWLWIGALVMIGGTIVVLVPAFQRKTVLAAQEAMERA